MKKKLLSFLLLTAACINLNAQTTVPQDSGYIINAASGPLDPPSTLALKAVLNPTSTATTSANARAPQGTRKYIKTAYIISAAEMAASGVTSGETFNSIGFTYSVAQDVATTGNMKIYLQNTSDASYAKTSDVWSDIIAPMTKVSDGSVTIPAATTANFTFSGGSTFNYTGGGLYIAFEYSNPSGTLAAIANTALCNTSITTGLKNYFSATADGTSVGLTASNFRPATKLGYALTNDIGVDLVYALGQTPLSYGADEAIKAYVGNYGDDDRTSIPFTLTVSGANNFLSTLTITSIPAGTVGTITFPTFTPTSLGTNTITVSAPTDNFNNNNTKTYTQEVTTGIISHYNNAPVAGSGGSSSGSLIIGTRYFVKGTSGVKAVNVSISTDAASVGKTVYAVAMNLLGVTLERSDDYVIQNSDLGTVKTFLLRNPVPLTDAEVVVGLALTGGTAFYPISYQTESPIRANTFYTRQVADGSSLGSSSLGRYMIGAVLLNGVLPVSLTDYKASVINNKAKISWTTLAEQNNDYFEVLKSEDGINFKTMTVLKGKGTTSSKNDYFVYDDYLSKGVNYYKLLQYDLNGKVTDCGVRYVNNKLAATASISTYPNPVVDRINIKLSDFVADQLLVSLVDITGKVVLVADYRITNPNANFELNIPSQLTKGNYILNFSHANGLVKSEKVIIQ